MNKVVRLESEFVQIAYGIVQGQGYNKFWKITHM
jgi:hypothetical protein